MAASRRTIKRGAFWSVLLPLISMVSPADAAAQAPDEAWRTIHTDHFRVTFPEGLEDLARRAGDRAEWAWTSLSDAFIEPPEGMIDLLVTDHADVSNGFAQVTPTNRITVYARPPVDALSLGQTDEWMELVVLHELAHIVHLDHADNPVGKAARAIFGRVSMEWPLFPELGTPRWIIEGLATWYESRLTQAGRVRGTFEEMQIRTAILEDRFEGIDQASGRSPLWPGGNRPYAYGSLFFDFLLERHGEDRMAEFVDAIAGQWIPYRLDAAGRDAFGVSLTDEWDAWRTSLEHELADLDDRLALNGPVTTPEALTEGARWGLHPRVSPDGRWVVHTRSDGRSDSQLRLIDLETGESRVLGRTNGLGVPTWLPDGRVLVSQVEFGDPYRLYSDLWIFDPAGGETRVTEGARLTQPSADRHGQVWAIQEGDGTNTIVRVDPEGDGDVVRLLPPRPDVHWAYPRPSPDGRWLVATRWTPNAHHDVVILDAGTGVVVDEVTSDRALDTTPSWLADGTGVVWASDRSGILNILEASIDGAGQAGSPRVVTNLRTGGAYPSVDPAGQWVYFAGYHADGWEIERARYSNGRGAAAGVAVARFTAEGAFPARGMVEGPVQAYSPGPTLAPAYWELASRDPVEVPAVQTQDLSLRGRELLGFGIGAQTSGVDLVGRHAWGAVGRVTTRGGKVEGGASYSFLGLGRPILSVSANQRYDSGGQLLGGDAPDQDTLLVLQRSRDVDVSITFPAPKWRYNLAVTAGAGFVWESRELWDVALKPTDAYSLARPTSRLAETSLALTFNSSRSHAFQMGTTRGLSLFLQGRMRNDLQLPDSLSDVQGIDRSFGEVVGRVRGAIPLWGGGRAVHVLAVQAVGGFAAGPGAGPLQFRVGGSSGQLEQLTGLELFGGGFLLFPVRGYDQLARFGRAAWSASAEYRFPIWFINRGFRAWPLHADRVVGAVFFDAGNAWGPDLGPNGFQNPLRDPVASVGAEVTTEFLGLYDVQLRLRLGGALPLVAGDGVRGYVRVGLPF